MRRQPMVARTRGQVLVLGAVALLVMALMLMASFSVTNAIHEKIRLQSHADAQAYSLAVIEARGFNVTAHYNRAIAATLVAELSLHSWMAIASNDVAMLNAGSIIMLMIAGFETMLGCYPFNFAHCPCVIMAMISSFKFFQASREWGGKVADLEQKFNDGVEGLYKMAKNLHDSQKDALTKVKNELGGGQMLSTLKSKNAAMAQNSELALRDMNLGDMGCALEGFDLECRGGKQRNKLSNQERSRIIANAGNAARTAFDRYGIAASMLSDDNFKGPNDPTVPKDQLLSGNWMHFFFTTSAVNSSTSTSASQDSEAKVVGAATNMMGVAIVRSFQHTPIMALPFTADVYSDGSSGKHSVLPPGGGNPHNGSHNKFPGVNQGSDPCGSEEACFVNYRALNDARKDFGQPSTYAGASQNLRIIKGKSGWGQNPPWEVNQSGKVKVELVKGQGTDVNYVPRGTGYAVSKGKVYFHQLGDWKAPPNMFDPFWRAKLHFFSRAELGEILGYVNDQEGVRLHGSGAPVEGEE